MQATNSRVRSFLYATAFVLLAIGLWLWLFPTTFATLPPPNAGNPWPWPIGPLALRFVASMFLGVGISVGLVAQRPDQPTLLALATGVAIGTSYFLLHLILNAANIDWLRPLAYVWAGGLGVGWIASLLAVRLLWPAQRLPVAPAPRSTRWIPLLIAVLTGPVGVLMFAFPEIGRARWPWELSNTLNVQLFGALFLSVCTAALWSWRQPSWYGYDRVYPGAATFSLVALIASFVHWNLFEPHPLAKWIFVVVYFLAGVLGLYPFLRYRPRDRGQGSGIGVQ